MPHTTVTIRKMNEEDIDSAMELVLSEGWNQTENDWNLFLDNSLNICLVAEIENRVVGTVTAFNYNNKIAWIGMVLVNKTHRGKGISKLMLAEIFKRLNCCQSIKLDATPAGSPVYKKMGFEEEYLINRMVCGSVDKMQKKNLTDNYHIDSLEDKSISEAIEFDEIAFGSNRATLLESLIGSFPGKCFVLKQNSKLAGFALGREGNKYHHIGPVTAVSAQQALDLIVNSLFYLQGKPVVIDILEEQTILIEALLKLGFEKKRHFMRMFIPPNAFPGSIRLQYLICGPEFG